MKHIHVVGSINMDLVATVERFPKPGETIPGKTFFTAHGGKGANQAVAAARLGASVSLVGCVGNDSHGAELLNALNAEKIDVSSIVSTRKSATGTAMILVNKHAENQIIVIPGANAHVASIQVDKALVANSDAVILQLEIPIDVVEHAAEVADSYGKTVFLNPAPAREIGKKLLRNVDYLILNETEAELLSGSGNSKEAARILLDRGASHVVITLGEKGAYYYDRKESGVVPGFVVEAVDPTAAGDAFIGGFAVRILEGDSLKDAIYYANAAGALAATRQGAQPSLPTKKDVEKLLKSSARHG